MINYLFFCFFFIFLQGFFSAYEMSIIYFGEIKLLYWLEKNRKNAFLVKELLNKPARLFSTVLIGINLSLILSSSFFTFFLIRLNIKESSLITSFFFTPFLVLFSELLPKNLGFRFPEISLTGTKIIIFFEKIFSPFVFSIEKLSNFLIRKILGKVKKRDFFTSREEIIYFIKEGEELGLINKQQRQALEKLFALKQKKVKDICKKNIVWLNCEANYLEILEVFKKNGFTRYPVFKNIKGEKIILGYVNIYEIFYNQEQLNWQKFIRKIIKVGFNQNLYDVFTLLKLRRETLALVIKGKKTYGLLTLEDLTKEIIFSLTH